VDVNNDGWIDLVVANDTVQNFLFHQYTTAPSPKWRRSGVAFDAYGLARRRNGDRFGPVSQRRTRWASHRELANEPNALYVSQNDSLVFADEAITKGWVRPAARFLKFGLFFFDYDLDGRRTCSRPMAISMRNSQTAAEPAVSPARAAFLEPRARAGNGLRSCAAGKMRNDIFNNRGRGSAFATLTGWRSRRDHDADQRPAPAAAQ